MDNKRPIITESQGKWYVVRTYNRKEHEVCEFFAKNGFVSFVPKISIPKGDGSEAPVRLVPAVRNMIFVFCSQPKEELLRVLSQCKAAVSALMEQDGDSLFEISQKEMEEFRKVCDPACGGIYVTYNFTQTLQCCKVLVTDGLLKGFSGNMASLDGKNYIVKTLAGVGVMVSLPDSSWQPL